MIESGPGYEVWLGEGLKGCRTSYHTHPHHKQVLTVVTGSLKVHDSGGTRLQERGQSTVQQTGESHELLFASDCTFIEVYTAANRFEPRPVESTKVVHYQ